MPWPSPSTPPLRPRQLTPREELLLQLGQELPELPGEDTPSVLDTWADTIRRLAGQAGDAVEWIDTVGGRLRQPSMEVRRPAPGPRGQGPQLRATPPPTLGQRLGAARDAVMDTVSDNPLLGLLFPKADPLSLAATYDPETHEIVQPVHTLTGTPDFDKGGTGIVRTAGRAAKAAERAVAGATPVGRGTSAAARAARGGPTALDASADAIIASQRAQRALPPAGGASALDTAADEAVAALNAGRPPLPKEPPAAAVVPEVLPDYAAQLFPKIDAYGKPATVVSAATIRKRAEAAKDLPEDVYLRLLDVANELGPRRVAPAEVQAMVHGVPYEPGRVLRIPRTLKEGETQVVGAPLGVATAADARKLREDYIKTMMEGVEGKDWYTDSGKAILFHANDDPARARLMAGDMAITSPTSSVGANTGFGIKANNQATARGLQAAGGIPEAEQVAIRAGRYPGAMGKNIAEMHAGGEGASGLKRLPFYHNLARGGNFLETPASPGWRDVELAPGITIQIPEEALELDSRAVHDVWDAEAHGFVNEDGTPKRTGFSPTQHRFMDRQQDKIIAKANRQQLGGFTDWDDLGTQAAAWTGAQRRGQAQRALAAAEKKRLAAGGDPAAAPAIRTKKAEGPRPKAISYADELPKHYATGHRDFAPGRTTGHMAELFDMPPRERDALLRALRDVMVDPASGLYDDVLRDQIAGGYGLPVGPGYEGPGMFQGGRAPGIYPRMLTGSEPVPGGAPGARRVDEGSALLMNATEATHGLGMGQDMWAWSRHLPAGTGVAPGLWDVALKGGKLSGPQLDALLAKFPDIGDQAVVPLPEGVRLGLMPAERKAEVVKELGARGTGRGGVSLESGLASGFDTNDWSVDRTAQGFLDPIRKIGGAAAFDAKQPAIFEKMRKANEFFRKESNGRVTLSKVVGELRAAAAGGGFADLDHIARKLGVPMALLTAGLGMALQEDSSAGEAAPNAM